MSIKLQGSDIRVCLAPMAGFTDSAMRKVAHDWGAELTFTEMISAKAVEFGDKKTRALARIEKFEGPCVLQLFGNDPEVIARAAGVMSREYGEDANPPVGIDVNMGCPVHKIFSNAEGSALMRDPELIYKIVKRTREEIDIPLSVKLRLGVDSEHINAVECALAAESAGADFITLHGRTRVQMYSGKSNLETIANVKRALHIPLIANGDVADAESALLTLKTTGADALMVGRAAIGNPFVFAEILAALDGGDMPEVTLELKKQVALRQLTLASELKGERTAVLESRKQLALYFRGINGAAALRGRLNSALTLREVESMLDELK